MTGSIGWPRSQENLCGNSLETTTNEVSIILPADLRRDSPHILSDMGTPVVSSSCERQMTNGPGHSLVPGQGSVHEYEHSMNPGHQREQ